jgi:hypothetical protein
VEASLANLQMGRDELSRWRTAAQEKDEDLKTLAQQLEDLRSGEVVPAPTQAELDQIRAHNQKLVHRLQSASAALANAVPRAKYDALREQVFRLQHGGSDSAAEDIPDDFMRAPTLSRYPTVPLSDDLREWDTWGVGAEPVEDATAGMRPEDAPSLDSIPLDDEDDFDLPAPPEPEPAPPEPEPAPPEPEPAPPQPEPAPPEATEPSEAPDQPAKPGAGDTPEATAPDPDDKPEVYRRRMTPWQSLPKMEAAPEPEDTEAGAPKDPPNELTDMVAELEAVAQEALAPDDPPDDKKKKR